MQSLSFLSELLLLLLLLLSQSLKAYLNALLLPLRKAAKKVQITNVLSKGQEKSAGSCEYHATRTAAVAGRKGELRGACGGCVGGAEMSDEPVHVLCQITLDTSPRAIRRPHGVDAIGAKI